MSVDKIRGMESSKRFECKNARYIFNELIEARCEVPESGYRGIDVGDQIPDARHYMNETRWKKPDTICQIPDIGE